MANSYPTEELFSWLSSILQAYEYDYVICVERKATAVIRMYLDFNGTSSKTLQWDGVLSSDALEYLPSGYLDGKNVLIFNEMVHQGSSTLRTLGNVVGNSKNVRRVEAAAFVCANDFPKEKWRAEWIRLGGTPDAPHHLLESGVSKTRYHRMWYDIVDMLRSSGALLLDTEHIETTFKLEMPIREFVDALCNVGLPIEYENDDINWPIGVTVRNPVIPDPERLLSLLPKGVDLEAAEPKKLRFVRRASNEFAAIAIWYPPLALGSVDEYIRADSFPSYIAPAISQCPEKTRPEFIFHICSLIASLELLKATWSALSPLIKQGKIIPNTPKGSHLPGEPLGHLRSLYPLIDFDSLESELQTAVSAYKDVSAVHQVQQRRREMSDWEGVCPYFVDLKKRSGAAKDILIELIESIIPIGIDEEWLADFDMPPEFLPFSWEQFWEAGKRLGINESIRSVAMDYVIDNAILKTTHDIVEREREKFVIRAYSTDSEFALDALIRLALGAESPNID